MFNFGGNLHELTYTRLHKPFLKMSHKVWGWFPSRQSTSADDNCVTCGCVRAMGGCAAGNTRRGNGNSLKALQLDWEESKNTSKFILRGDILKISK